MGQDIDPLLFSLGKAQNDKDNDQSIAKKQTLTLNYFPKRIVLFSILLTLSAIESLVDTAMHSNDTLQTVSSSLLLTVSMTALVIYGFCDIDLCAVGYRRSVAIALGACSALQCVA